jgi:hypothetical protein
MILRYQKLATKYSAVKRHIELFLAECEVEAYDMSPELNQTHERFVMGLVRDTEWNEIKLPAIYGGKMPMHVKHKAPEELWVNRKGNTH